MRIYGDEKWTGKKPGKATIKQEILMDIIYKLTGDRLSTYNSKSAYRFIGKYKDKLSKVKMILDIDTCDKYVYYADMFIDGKYIFTVKNYCHKKIDIDNIIESKVYKYEIEYYTNVKYDDKEAESYL